MSDQIVAAGMTHAELSAAFDTVADPSDWRAPIEAFVDAPAYARIAAAVEFFTATKLSWVMLPNGRFAVTSIGYRNGPAGP